MTHEEFCALKKDDEIIGMNGSIGTVFQVTKARNGVVTVAIEWTPGAPLFTFVSNGTAWMHWSRKDEEGAA